MSYNVPAVCDVFLRPMKKLRSSFRAQKNVGGARRGNEAQRNDLAARNPRSDQRERRRIRPCYTTLAQPMSYNVPAVYDVLAARIRKCVAFPGPANCGWSVAWE
jgi:hypothetical protein